MYIIASFYACRIQLMMVLPYAPPLSLSESVASISSYGVKYICICHLQVLCIS